MDDIKKLKDENWKLRIELASLRYEKFKEDYPDVTLGEEEEIARYWNQGFDLETAYRKLKESRGFKNGVVVAAVNGFALNARRGK